VNKMINLELKAACIAMDDYTAPVAKKKWYDPKKIVWEVLSGISRYSEEYFQINRKETN